MRTMIAGLTGASGSVYFSRMLEALREQDLEIRIIATDQGERVFLYETGISLEEQLVRCRGERARFIREDNGDLFSPVASGSYGCRDMIVMPCSMSSLAEFAGGTGKTLLCRAADVVLKERGRLVVVPRETPLSTLHLENMWKLSRLGAVILPAMPGFYGHPKTLDDCVDFVAGKALDALGIKNSCYSRWDGIAGYSE